MIKECLNLNKKDLFYDLLYMLANHKDLQAIPSCKDFKLFLESIFLVPETGIFYNIGTYEINPKGVLIKSWDNQKTVRFSWSSLEDSLRKYPKAPTLF